MGRGRMRRGTYLGFAGSRNKSEESREGAAGLGKDFARSGRGRKGRISTQATAEGGEEGFGRRGTARIELCAQRIRVRAKLPEESTAPKKRSVHQQFCPPPIHVAPAEHRADVAMAPSRGGREYVVNHCFALFQNEVDPTCNEANPGGVLGWLRPWGGPLTGGRGTSSSREKLREMKLGFSS